MRKKGALHPDGGSAPGPSLPGSRAGRGMTRLRRGEPLPASIYTGWDIHGSDAEHPTIAGADVHPLPEGFSDAELAPLLCAGIIGYRALLRAETHRAGI